MNIKLTDRQKSQSWCCSCPLPSHMGRRSFSKKTILIEFGSQGVTLFLIWLMSPPAVLVLMGLYFICICINFLYRLIRGHTLSCAAKWSPFVVSYVLGSIDGIGTSEDPKKFK